MGGYDLNDNVQAAMTLSNMGVQSNPNDPHFAALQGQVKQMTDQYGGLGATSAAQFLQTAHSTQSIYAGRRIGIETTGKGGAAKSPREIAQEILGQYRGHETRGSAGYQKEISAAQDQGAGIDQRLDALGFQGEQKDILNRTISDLAAGREVGKDADNKLDSQTKDTAQSQMETTSETAKSMADGAAKLKGAMEAFRDGINAMLRGSKGGGAWGWISGVASQLGGPRSSLAGIAPVAFEDGRQEGGPIGDAVGAGAGGAQGVQGIEDAVRKLGIKFGPPTIGQTTGGKHSSGSSHYAGLAVDFGDATSDSGAIAKALEKYAKGKNAPISELIYSKMNIGYKNGSNVGEAGYGARTWADHMDHVHVAVREGVNLADVVSGNYTPGADDSAAADGASTQKDASSSASFGGITNSAAAFIPEGKTSSLLGAGPGGGGGGGGSKESSSDEGTAGATDDASVEGSSATGDQESNARTIIGVAKSMGLPRQAALVALMAAYQESGLKNLQGGDRDSAGLFQMRPSMGWGTLEQVTNPHYAGGGEEWVPRRLREVAGRGDGPAQQHRLRPRLLGGRARSVRPHSRGRDGRPRPAGRAGAAGVSRTGRQSGDHQRHGAERL
jgi:hypothetical protein